MPCYSRLSVALLSLAALCCAGCELPHGPLRWDPLHLDLHHLSVLPRGELNVPSPFQIADSCEEHPDAQCQSNPRQREPQLLEPNEAGAPLPDAPRFTRHHHAVPLAGPGVTAPWPKFHPVPTRPVFEPQCLVPVPETSRRDSGVVLLKGQAETE